MEDKVGFVWVCCFVAILVGCALYINYQGGELKKWENFGESFYYDELITTNSNMTYENLGFRGMMFHYGKEENENSYNLWWKNNLSEEAIGFYYNVDNKMGDLKVYNLTSNQTRTIKFKRYN